MTHLESVFFQSWFGFGKVSPESLGSFLGANGEDIGWASVVERMNDKRREVSMGDELNEMYFPRKYAQRSLPSARQKAVGSVALSSDLAQAPAALS